jgi:hypothetical protein
VAITNGTFTSSQLAKSILMADAMWSNEMVNADYIADVENVRAIIAEQNAKTELINRGDKDREVRVHWLNMCEETTAAVGDNDCAPNGTELGSDHKDYAIGVTRKFDFKVDELELRSNDYNFEDLVAKGILKADRALSNYVATTLQTKLETFKGENSVDEGLTGTGQVDGDETYISASDWNERLFAYFYRIAIQNRLTNPFLLSGSNMFEDKFISLLSEQNSNGKGSANLFRVMRTYFDLFNVDTANSPDLKTYMINRGAIAFVNRHYYDARPTRYFDDERFSLASRNIPGLTYDVFYRNACSGSTVLHNWSFRVKFDFFLNPLGCDATRTGVLSFIKGEVPE